MADRPGEGGPSRAGEKAPAPGHPGTPSPYPLPEGEEAYPPVAVGFAGAGTGVAAAAGVGCVGATCAVGAAGGVGPGLADWLGSAVGNGTEMSVPLLPPVTWGRRPSQRVQRR